jgi:hypothetical protein
MENFERTSFFGLWGKTKPPRLAEEGVTYLERNLKQKEFIGVLTHVEQHLAL